MLTCVYWPGRGGLGMFRGELDSPTQTAVLSSSCGCIRDQRRRFEILSTAGQERGSGRGSSRRDGGRETTGQVSNAQYNPM